MLELHDIEGILDVLKFNAIFAFDNGDDIEPYVLLAPVALDVLVSEPYHIEPFLMHYGIFGAEDGVVGTRFHLHYDQFVRCFIARWKSPNKLWVGVEGDDVYLQVSHTVISLQNSVSVVLQILRCHLLTQATQFQRLTPLLRRELVFSVDMYL